jgi:hypothetical protein
LAASSGLLFGAISLAVTKKGIHEFFGMGEMIMDSSTKQYLAYSLTMMLLSLPCVALAQAQTGATPPSSTGGGDDAIYCRPPEPRTDSRMMGPKVCLPVQKWKELRAKGLDVSADGSSIVQMQNGPLTSSGTP